MIRTCAITKTYDRTPIAQVGALGLEPNGSTPLRDALHRFLTEAKSIIDDAADDTERLLLVIITDGQENASRMHSWSDIRKLLAQVEWDDCETIFMGTTDALVEAEDAMPSFRSEGASLGYQPSASGVNYMSSGFVRAASATRFGASARAATSAYVRQNTGTSGSSARWPDAACVVPPDEE